MSVKYRLQKVQVIYVHNLTGPPECDPTSQSGWILNGHDVDGAGACKGCSTTGQADCKRRCEDHPDCAGWTLATATNRCWLSVEGFKTTNGYDGWEWGHSCKGKQMKSKLY